MAITIINPGRNVKKQYKHNCKTCGCEFLFQDEDIQPDRDGDYIVCPNDSCKAFTSVDSYAKLEKMIYIPTPPTPPKDRIYSDFQPPDLP